MSLITNNAERRHLEPGVKSLIKWDQLEASQAWEREWQRRKEEANRRRSAVATERERTERGTFVASSGSNDPLLGKSKEDRHVERKAVAQAAGTSEATAARAKGLRDKRPDLAKEVRASKMKFNEALRQMRKDVEKSA